MFSRRSGRKAHSAFWRFPSTPDEPAHFFCTVLNLALVFGLATLFIFVRGLDCFSPIQNNNKGRGRRRPCLLQSVNQIKVTFLSSLCLRTSSLIIKDKIRRHRESHHLFVSRREVRCLSRGSSRRRVVSVDRLDARDFLILR